MSRRDPSLTRCPHPMPAVPDMIGVTLVSPAYMELLPYAVAQFKEMTGLDTMVIFTADEPAFLRKLQLPDLVGPRKICFYDVDWRPVKPINLRVVSQWGHFMGVPDFGAKLSGQFPFADCETFGIDPSKYINTGFFICDLGNESHCEVFTKAQELAFLADQGIVKRVADFGEQTWLNLALHLLKVHVSKLPEAYNCFLSRTAEVSEEIIAVHAAGVPIPDKLQALLDYH